MRLFLDSKQKDYLSEHCTTQLNLTKRKTGTKKKNVISPKSKKSFWPKMVNFLMNTLAFVLIAAYVMVGVSFVAALIQIITAIVKGNLPAQALIFWIPAFIFLFLGYAFAAILFQEGR